MRSRCGNPGRLMRVPDPLCGRYPDSGQGRRGGHHQDGLPGHWCRRGRPQHALGCWIQDTEGAKFWQKVLADLRNRGVKDVLVACCDGLTGLPDAIRAVFPDTVVQTCVVHVIRNAMRFVSYGDRKKVVKAMKEIYTAPTLEAAELGLAAFDKQFGAQYPGAVDVWRNCWDEFIPFLDYPAELRKIVYTTNSIESINFQLRKSPRIAVIFLTRMPR